MEYKESGKIPNDHYERTPEAFSKGRLAFCRVYRDQVTDGGRAGRWTAGITSGGRVNWKTRDLVRLMINEIHTNYSLVRNARMGRTNFVEEIDQIMLEMVKSIISFKM